MARKTPEEMAIATRKKVARSMVRLKHSINADYELNDLLADMEDDHMLELHSGGLKQIEPGALDRVISDIADIEAVIHGVKPEDRPHGNRA